MTFRPISAILFLALVTLSATAPLAQQIRERDTTLFERCRPLTAIASMSNRETLTALQDILAARGFAISAIDLDRGELSAIKRDQTSTDRSDRVLLWLERDPFKPGERAYIYFMGGRFEPFVGSTGGPVRVRMWPDELGRMTALQEAIVAFAMTRP
jgi:hypothetical protein